MSWANKTTQAPVVFFDCVSFQTEGKRMIKEPGIFELLAECGHLLAGLNGKVQAVEEDGPREETDVEGAGRKNTTLLWRRSGKSSLRQRKTKPHLSQSLSA